MSTNGSRALADSLVYPYLNHAASMYEEGYASREDLSLIHISEPTRRS